MSPESAEATDETPWKHLRLLTESGNRAGLDKYVMSLEIADRIRAFSRLDAETQERLVLLLSPETAAEIVADLPESQAAALIERLGVDQAADIVEVLRSDQGADLLADLERHDADAILDQMELTSASRVRQLIVYPDEVAGGLMGTEEYACNSTETVDDFLRNFRRDKAQRGYLPQRILLVDDNGRLTGSVEIAEVLLANRETRLATLQQPAVPVSDYASLDELDEYFQRHETLGAPVVNADGQLVGRLRRRAFDDRLARRAQESQLKSQGIVSGDELRSMPVMTRSRRRLSWLSINIVLNMIAASVIAYFQDTISAVIALAVFLPIVSDMSGCSGNQAVAVSMRELTLGIVKPRDVARVWLKEISIGFLNGIALGTLLGAVAYVWLGNALLGLVVGVALGLNTMVAVSIGGTVPLMLKGFRIDPAIASGPVLTTVTDMCGFFFVLGLATLALPWLV
jgi:magnesium transporter